MGYLDNHCLCVCYKSRHGKFRSGGYHCAWIIDMSDDYSPHVLLAVLFIITNLFTD